MLKWSPNGVVGCNTHSLQKRGVVVSNHLQDELLRVPGLSVWGVKAHSRYLRGSAAPCDTYMGCVAPNFNSKQIQAQVGMSAELTKARIRSYIPTQSAMILSRSCLQCDLFE